MDIGAIGYNTEYYRENASLGRREAVDGISNFLTVGSATQESTSSNNGKNIGLTAVGDRVFLAKYADTSTLAEPIIKVGDYEVRVNDVDPNNATELEMFAWMSYMEDAGLIEKHGMTSFSKMKAYALQSEYDGVCSGIYDEQAFWDKKQNWPAIIGNAKQTFSGMTETYTQAIECGKLLSQFEKWGLKTSYSDLFSEAVQNFKNANLLTAQELKADRDWREMSDEEWEKVLADVDEYIDAFKKQLKKKKEMQEEAAQKAAMEADSDMRATAASSAALGVVANGLGCTAEGDAEDGADYEKNWTKNLKTDDQTILRTAQVAQDMEKMAMSKLQEVQLTDSTVVGISRSENVTECAFVEEDENKEKIWTITAFGEDGIVSTRCQNGKILDSWEIKYTHSDDAKRVWDFLAKFDGDPDIKYAGSKDFWEDFLKNETCG